MAWILGMMGWVRNPHGPEMTAVRRVYHELAAYIDSVGSGKAQEGRQKLVPILKSAEEILSAGHVPWKSSGQYQRLLLLNDQANAIFLDVME